MMRVGAVVLAAGAGSRFGGGKLLAILDGRPVLQHVLDAIAAAGIEATTVVLGADARAVERAVAWRGERRIVNPRPADGLSSSLRLGIRDAAASEPPPDALLVALGDQPRLRPEVVRALVEALASDASRPIAVPAYADDRGRNPVLLGRAAWRLADDAVGDRGLGPLLAAEPALVAAVPVPGDNPDVDTPADLARLATR
jgi:CTP:molybdopterin cytidylyltransferase MocA